MIYGYIRVSTDKQTTENQRFEINNYCTKNNIKIDEIISETVSGTEEFEKRKLGKLFKKIKKGDVLIISELSRLSRTMHSVNSVLGKFEKCGIEVIAIKECLTLKKDNISRYLAPIIAIVGEIERNLISQRTKEGLARKKSEGVKLGRPHGSKSKNKKLTGKEEIIAQMKSENTSLRKMAKKLKVSVNTLRNFARENAIFS